MADEVERRVAELRGVVRRDRGGHAHRNALGAVGEEVREGGGEHHRFLVLAVVGVAEIDGVLVDAFQKEPRDLGEAGLRVPVGGGVVAVDVAEIPLAVDERIALREILGQAHQRVIDRLVSVGMVFADHVADDAGALLVGVARIEAQKPHGVQDAAVDRLQPVPGVGQRPVHDRGQRIGEIALFESLLEVDGLDLAPGGRVHRLTHERKSPNRIGHPSWTENISETFAVVPCGSECDETRTLLGRGDSPRLEHVLS